MNSRDFLQNYATYIDANGYGLIHYISAWRVSEATQRDQLIKELNLDVNLRSARGETALLVVCEQSGHDPEAINTLIKGGADVNAAVGEQ